MSDLGDPGYDAIQEASQEAYQRRVTMTWHYRIMQDENGEWGVHEVYCDGDDLQPHSWTEEPVFAGGCEDVEAVRREIHRLAGDAYRPPISKLWQDEHLERAADAEELSKEDRP